MDKKHSEHDQRQQFHLYRINHHHHSSSRNNGNGNEYIYRTTTICLLIPTLSITITTTTIIIIIIPIPVIGIEKAKGRRAALLRERAAHAAPAEQEPARPERAPRDGGARRRL